MMPNHRNDTVANWFQHNSKKTLAELPVYCDVGTKKNSKGYKETWIGYKLHAASMIAACPSVWR